MKDNDMDKNNKELSLEELEAVSGGDMAMWRALDVIFNGAEMWRDLDDLEVDLGKRFKLMKKIEKLTGIEIDLNCVCNGNKDVVFKMPDGTMLNEDQFLDYIRATYSMDEILSWHTM